MSILSTVKKGYLYMKTSSGYLKLLPRTLATLVSMSNGNSVETEISNIKTAASNLSTTVSSHTTKLNGLKNGSTSTVANNLTTTASGYVLDARQGKTLNDSISTLNSTLEKKLDQIVLGVDKPAAAPGEWVQDKQVYYKMIDCGALPNKTTKTVNTGLPSNLTYFWIDPSNSFAFNGGGASYPVPFSDNSTTNTLSIRMTNKGATISIGTASDWSSYACIVCVKYTK